MRKVRCFAGVGVVMAAAAGLVVGVSGSGGIADAAGIPWGQRPVTVGTGFVIGNGSVIGRPAVSASGRWVAFVSAASNLVPGDTNGKNDLFFRDRWNDRTDRVAENVKSIHTLTRSGKLLVFRRADDTYAAYNRDTKTTTKIPMQVRELGPEGGAAVSMNDDGWYQSRTGIAGDTSPNFSCQVSQLVDDGTIRGPFDCADWVPTDEAGATWSFGESAWTTGLEFRVFVGRRADNVWINSLPTYDLFKANMVTGERVQMSVQTSTPRIDQGLERVQVSSNGRYVAAVSDNGALVWWDTVSGVEHTWDAVADNHGLSISYRPVVLDDGRVVIESGPFHATDGRWEPYALTVRFATDGAVTIGKATARWDNQIATTLLGDGQNSFASDINRVIACSDTPVGPLDTNTFLDCNLVPIANV